MLKKFKNLFMRLMVWNMKWMTRYLGFIARPIIKLVAANEIIACGLKSPQGDNNIIYTPYPGRDDYNFLIKKNIWQPTLAITTNNFSGELVRQVSLPEVTEGNVIRVKARQKNRSLYSPKITVKPNTQYRDDLIDIEKTKQGLKIVWNKCETYKPMIYFLVLQSKTINLAGIYTREYKWEYPKIKQASLNVGSDQPIILKKGEYYQIKVVVVDYDGWAPVVATKEFTY